MDFFFCKMFFFVLFCLLRIENVGRKSFKVSMSEVLKRVMFMYVVKGMICYELMICNLKSVEVNIFFFFL